MIVAVPTATTYVGDSVRKTITAYEKGTTLLTVYSNETGKTSKITVNVVKVASSIGFKNDNLALPSVIGSKLKLDDSYIQTYPERSDITNVSYQIGKYDGSDNFVEYTNEELSVAGIGYDKNSSTLTVMRDSIAIDSFVIKANYDNPFAKDDSLNFDIIKNTLQMTLTRADDLILKIKFENEDVSQIIKNTVLLGSSDVENRVISKAKHELETMKGKMK